MCGVLKPDNKGDKYDIPTWSTISRFRHNRLIEERGGRRCCAAPRRIPITPRRVRPSKDSFALLNDFDGGHCGGGGDGGDGALKAPVKKRPNGFRRREGDAPR